MCLGPHRTGPSSSAKPNRPPRTVALWKMRRRTDLGLHDHAFTVTGDSRGAALEAAPDPVAADPAHVLPQTKSPPPHTHDPSIVNDSPPTA